MKFLTQLALIPLLLLLLLVALPFVAWAIALWAVRTLAIRIGVWFSWIPRGQRFLIVYSDSAQWKPYLETEVVPGFGRSARVINVSRDGSQKRWWRLEWAVQQHCGGSRNHFPVVYRFSMLGPWRSVRFHDAYMLAKKGKTSDLDTAKDLVRSWQPRSGASPGRGIQH